MPCLRSNVQCASRSSSLDSFLSGGHEGCAKNGPQDIGKPPARQTEQVLSRVWRQAGDRDGRERPGVARLIARSIAGSPGSTCRV